MQPECMAQGTPDCAHDESVQSALADLIGSKAYNHWFHGKTRLSVCGNELVVDAASPFLAKWLQKQFRAALSQAAHHVLGPAARVRFSAEAPSAGALVPVAAAPGISQTLAATAAPQTALSPLRPAEPRAVARPHEPARDRTGRKFADLSEFVPGACNALALTAVGQVCERPDGAGGPLVVYGPVGTGKTHLLEGIYRHIRRHHGSLNVVFLTSEQFTNYFTQAYREHTLPAFRQRFRTVDVLLVDDVDFLDAKRVVQEEFLHTFKQLESHGRLVVATADRHPRLLTKISDELKTRLLSGMVCRLEVPGPETREAIAVKKVARLNAEIGPDAVRYVAQRFRGSVRELEGALQCLQVYYRMTGKRVGVTAARQVLADLERDCVRIVRLGDIERVVCELFGVDAGDLKSERRTRSVSEPRMLAMYLARRHTRAAYSEIGEFFGGRNHATVISAERKVAEWLGRETELKIASQTWRLADVLSTLEQQLLAG